MSKLNSTIRISSQYDRQSFYDTLRYIDQQVNGLSEGRLENAYNAAAAIPTTGTYAQGDFIRNSTPTELGSASSKYVVFGFICVASGTPGTWKELRCLTGN